MTELQKIFDTAEKAAKKLFVEKSTKVFRLRKQKLFPKGITIVWNSAKPDSGYEMDAFAQSDSGLIRIVFPEKDFNWIEHRHPLKMILVHEITHVAQKTWSKPHRLSLLNAVLDSHYGMGAFRRLRTFMSILSPIEAEAVIAEGIYQYGQNALSPIYAVEDVLDYYFKGCGNCEYIQRDFIFKNIILNVIPNSPFLSKIFKDDVIYKKKLMELKGQQEFFERTSRLFFHTQNLVKIKDNKILDKTMNHFRKVLDERNYVQKLGHFMKDCQKIRASVRKSRAKKLKVSA